MDRSLSIAPLSSKYQGCSIETFACNCKKGLYYWSEFSIGQSNYASELVASPLESIEVAQDWIDRILADRVTPFRSGRS